MKYKSLNVKMQRTFLPNGSLRRQVNDGFKFVAIFGSNTLVLNNGCLIASSCEKG